jgi:hypothetical protein
VTESAAIERRDVGDALSQIVGTGDTRAMLEQVERNVRTVIDVARDRGFVRRYGDNQHEFFGEPAWSLLGMTYGLVAFIEWTRAVDNGWEARAVARTREGTDVSSAEAMCTRAEQNRRNAPDHTLRAMAQTRARRNALRSALGAALVLAGFDFADPDAPATKDQTKAIWTLAGKHGWDRDEAHERAGVDSMKDLTRETAAELIDEWSDLDSSGGSPPAPETAGEGPLANVESDGASPAPRSSSATRSGETNAATGTGEESEAATRPAVSDSDPATQEQWQRLMLVTGGSKQKAVNRVNRANGTQYTQANVAYATVAEVARAITGEKK